MKIISSDLCQKPLLKKGFTLIELLVVMSIISVLSSIVLASLSDVRALARDSKRIQNMATIQLALELYYSDHNEYPRVYTCIIPTGCNAPEISGHYLTGWDTEGDIFDNVATNWSALMDLLKQDKYIARAEAATQAYTLANRSFLESFFAWTKIIPEASAYNDYIQDPLFPARSYAYMPSSEDNPKYQNYRIRAHLEKTNSTVLTSGIVGKFLTIDDDVGPPNFYENDYAHLLCYPPKGYYCIGPKRDTFSGYQPGKPVVYLYPTETTDVSVQVFAKSIDESIPTYSDGWKVTAHPDGSIINHADGITYPYLFWEGKSERPIVDRTKGFVIETKDVIPFLTSSLSKLGLKENEASEFIEYWAPRMTTAEPYVYVYFMPKSDYDTLIPMTVTPKPDTVIRVYMLFKPITEKVVVTPQELSAPERIGFTVVEWGGDRSALR